MNEIEQRAQEYYRRGDWPKALECFETLIADNSKHFNGNYAISREKVIAFLIGRSECNLELGHCEIVQQDCHRILNYTIDNNINNFLRNRVRKLLLKALIVSKKYSEAEVSIDEWLGKGILSSSSQEILLQVRNKIGNQQYVDCSNLYLKLETDLSSFDSHFIDGSHLPSTLHYENNMPPEGSVSKESKSMSDFSCSYCAIRFNDELSLRIHCQSGSHQTIIMSDEGRDWKFRPPPRGLTSAAYTLCECFKEKQGMCRYGERCVEAHGPEELQEWKERFEYRKMKVQRASEKQLYGKSYTEQLLEKWINAASPDAVMRERIDNLEESVSGDLVTSVSSKNSQREWNFLIKSPMRLRAVALLQDTHRNHFSLRHVSSCDPAQLNSTAEWKPTNDQEWTCLSESSSNERDSDEGENKILEHRICVGFKTEIYGTFRQSVVFDFGSDPVLVKHLCVDVVPVTDVDKMKEIQKEAIVSSGERWCNDNSKVIPFTSTLLPVTPTSLLDMDKERRLLDAYPTPRADAFTLTQSTVLEKCVTKNNYRDRMHELLYVEEMARYEQVARYNVTTTLQVVNCYFLAPNGMANSTAKYSHGGELYAVLSMGKSVSEDTSAGRLILNNCSTVFIYCDKKESRGTQRVVYEALIEDKGKSKMYLRISAVTVKALNLRAETDLKCQVQFQLNRVPYCEWHYAVDKIGDYRLIFPETTLEPSIPWTPQRQWNDKMDPRLNSKQREAVVAITSPAATTLPPILIIGPFGTGKTFTLAQAIKLLLTQSDARILVCTHSNSAADLYIKDYLHPYVEDGHEEARPLRIYYHKRWVATVNTVVQKYCLIEMNNGMRSFKIPTLEDIMKHRIVVVTLSISMYLSSLGLKRGHFTHILLDEAAQAMECEAIMPLALANEHTRIVLAGDHMQLSPELFSQFAKDRNLHVSLLERLYDHYPSSFPCKILLCENYRAHEAIINFTSELFYDQKLISSGKQPRHDRFYPLTFFTTRGEDVQDVNSTAFYNNSEVYEVVERVCELRKQWPSSWGKLEDQSIGIMTPYADQVFRIRSELRKRRLGSISVERVLNVQGKQFRAIFLSTVRTRRTCLGANGKPINELDFGFLSNWKLLNTAITRAQSLVAVVGDPIALCSIGRCRKVWERFIEVCNNNKSLYGITWGLLRNQLDGVELKKSFTLNPLAPEFIPRALQNESYIRLPPMLARAIPSFIPPPTACPLLYYPPINPVNTFPLRPPGVALSYIGAPSPWTTPFGPISPTLNKEEMKPTVPLGLQPTKPPTIMDMKALLPNLEGLDNLTQPGLVLDGALRPSPLQMHGMISERRIPHIPLPTPILRPGLEFLNNVHFPERLPLRTSVPPPSDWQALLPPNMSLVEVLDSRSIQIEWYRHLLNSFGFETAEKFKELVIRASEKPIPPPSERQIPVNIIDRVADMRLSPKPIILRDFEATLYSHGPAQAPQILPPPTPSQIPASQRSQQLASMPLYRRQTNVPNFQHQNVFAHTNGYVNDFHLNGREQDLEESAASKNNVETTYASVLRKQPNRGPGGEGGPDQLGIFKVLARSSSAQSNGLYQYFS